VRAIPLFGTGGPRAADLIQPLKHQEFSPQSHRGKTGLTTKAPRAPSKTSFLCYLLGSKGADMRLLQIACACCLMWLALASTAQAVRLEDYLIKNQKPQPFEGWTLEQIKADPRFIPWDKFDTPMGAGGAPSSARDTSVAGWPAVYKWIGCIELPQNYLGRYAVVVFDSTGAGVTMVADCGGAYDDLVPLWFGRTIEYLEDVGIMEGYP
jgi:hypothetical protein